MAGPAPAHLSGNWNTFDFAWPDEASSADSKRGAQFVVLESRTLGDNVVHVTVPDFVLSSLRDIARPLPR